MKRACSDHIYHDKVVVEIMHSRLSSAPATKARNPASCEQLDEFIPFLGRLRQILQSKNHVKLNANGARCPGGPGEYGQNDLFNLLTSIIEGDLDHIIP